MLLAVQPVGEAFLLGFRGLTPPDWLGEFEARFGLGGVLLFDYDVQTRRQGRNITSPDQLRSLCAELAAFASRPLVCVDQEGGRVRRLKPAVGFSELPSAAVFAQLEPTEQYPLAAAAYREMVALGIQLNLAPVVDLNLNPRNPNIGAIERSFSADPEILRVAARSLFAAARESGLLLCLKHYPGLGAARADSHLERTELREVPPDEQLELFETLADEVPGRAVLLSHALLADWDPAWPVSLSRHATSRLRARQPDALLISDDLQMQGLRVFADSAGACERAIENGVDLLCIGNNLQGGEEECFEAAVRLSKRAARDPDFKDSLDAAVARVQLRKATRARAVSPDAARRRVP